MHYGFDRPFQHFLVYFFSFFFLSLTRFHYEIQISKREAIKHNFFQTFKPLEFRQMP